MGIDTTMPFCDDTVSPSAGCDGCPLWAPGMKDPKCWAADFIGNKRGLHPGYPLSFDQVELYAGRMAEAASAHSQRGLHRFDKSWIPAFMPRTIFINDLGDIFSKAVPFSYVEAEVIDTVVGARGRRHVWLLFTKKWKRLLEFDRYLEKQGRAWPANLWAGVSIINQKALTGLDSLAQVRAEMRFVSAEPLWEAIDLRPWLPSISWLIIGGESGSREKAAPFDIGWAEDLVRQCREGGVAPFVKQLGRNPIHQGKRLRLRHPRGEDWSEWPEELEHLRIREFPEEGGRG